MTDAKNSLSCFDCKHHISGIVCAAYPDGIPWPIQSGDVSHLTPLPGDNGIRFEPIDEQEADNG
jgi:hypothetical protein